MTKYRYNIGIDKYLYGTELEFTNAILEEAAQGFKEKKIPSILLLNHKNYSPTYDKNYLDKDNTVSYEENGIIYGGEISSRLYNNKKIDWAEIESICNILLEKEAIVVSNCSNHISVDLSVIKNKVKFLEGLARIVSSIEEELETYYMGDSYLVRGTKKNYAYSISMYLKSVLDYIDFNSNCEWEISNLLLPIFSKSSGISLSNFNTKQYMEIRYPNGTLNKKTIQNNINFSLKLVDAIATGKIDYELISLPNSQKKFINLVKLISTSSEDENDFVSQYEKVLSTKPRL